MSQLEPTYLRYIYDGLIKGSIHPENAAELPDGLIGLYEEAFDERYSVVDRQKLLQRFTIWALLKKEVSAAFVAEILNESEEEIMNFISTYSAWFNSPESGKYQLYHERLKVYLLQKLSEREVSFLQEKIVAKLKSALANETNHESENYALEFLSEYLVLNSQLLNDFEPLHENVNNKVFWDRQIRVSKGFEWTHKGIIIGLREAARRENEFATIQTIVSNIKLDTREQNSAEEILKLLVDGNIQLAIQRAERWSGNRLLTLYMLMFHELIFGDSKNLKNRREACLVVIMSFKTNSEKFVRYENDEVFFPFIETLRVPVALAYLYISNLEKMEIDGMVIFENANYSLKPVFKHFLRTPNRLIHLFKIALNDENEFLELIKEFVNNIDYVCDLELVITSIVEFINGMESNYYKSLSYSEIIKIFAIVGLMNHAWRMLEKALASIEEIQLFSLKDFRIEQCYESLIEPALYLNRLDLAIEYAENCLNWDYERKSGYNSKSLISNFLVKNGRIDQSIDLARSLEDDILNHHPKSQSLHFISIAMMEMTQYQESIRFASEIPDSSIKFDTYIELAKISSVKGQIELHEEIMQTINNLSIALDCDRQELFSRTYKTAFLHLHLGNKSQASEKCFEALNLRFLKSYQQRYQIEELSLLFVQLGFYEEAFHLVDEFSIPAHFIYPKIYLNLCHELDCNAAMESILEIAFSRNESCISNEILDCLAEHSSLDQLRKYFLESLKRPAKKINNSLNVESKCLGELKIPVVDQLEKLTFESSLKHFNELIGTVDFTPVNIEHLLYHCSTIQNEFDRIKGYLILCDMMLEQDLIQEVEKILETKIIGRIPNSFVSYLFDETNKIHSCLFLKKGIVHEAYVWASKIKDKATKVDSLFDILSTFVNSQMIGLQINVKKEISDHIMQLLEWVDHSMATITIRDTIIHLPQNDFLVRSRTNFFKAASNIQNELHRSFACKNLAIILYLKNEKFLSHQVIDMIKVDQVKHETYYEICSYLLCQDLSQKSIDFLSDIIKDTSFTNIFNDLIDIYGLERVFLFYMKYFHPNKEIEFVDSISTYFQGHQELSNEFPLLHQFTDHKDLQKSYLNYKVEQCYASSGAENEKYKQLLKDVI